MHGHRFGSGGRTHQAGSTDLDGHISSYSQITALGDHIFRAAGFISNRDQISGFDFTGTGIQVDGRGSDCVRAIHLVTTGVTLGVLRHVVGFVHVETLQAGQIPVSQGVVVACLAGFPKHAHVSTDSFGGCGVQNKRQLTNRAAIARQNTPQLGEVFQVGGARCEWHGIFRTKTAACFQDCQSCQVGFNTGCQRVKRLQVLVCPTGCHASISDCFRRFSGHDNAHCLARGHCVGERFGNIGAGCGQGCGRFDISYSANLWNIPDDALTQCGSGQLAVNLDGSDHPKLAPRKLRNARIQGRKQTS